MEDFSAFELLCVLATETGAAPIAGKIWRTSCPPWEIWVNGHGVHATTEDKVKIPPFHVYVEFNGWPAGLFSPYGGSITAGEAANEETLRAAIIEEIERGRRTRPN